MVRSDVCRDFHPETKYRVRCPRYWPVIEIEGGGHGGSTYGGVHRVIVAVEGGGRPIEQQQGFSPRNQIPSAAHSVLAQDRNQ